MSVTPPSDSASPHPSPGWANQPTPQPTPPPPPTQPAGWYPDPWAQAAWRWYDGRSWTAHLAEQTAPTPAVGETKKPRLPSFLSIPVVLAAVPAIILLLIALIQNWVAVALGAVPLFIVAPVLIWMDRIEPEPWSSRLHTLLWGAFVAGFISLVVNTIFAIVAGAVTSPATGETLAAVISAPLIEEITKGAGILWMVRRKEVDSIMDGLVYAGWAGLGFAAIEDVSFFFLAAEQDLLLETFIGRAIFTPFAHPLFTAWTGLAIGWAVQRRKSLWHTLWGLALAIGSHAAWNGSITLAESEGGAIVAGVAIVGFILLFFATIIGVILLRRRDQKRYVELLPQIAIRYNLPPERIMMLLTPRSRSAARKALPDKAARQKFDCEASAVARLAALFDHQSQAPPEDEARLVSMLVNARKDH